MPMRLRKLRNICPSRKLVFIHIPKTGGTTVTRIFLNRRNWIRHLPITEYRSYFDHFIFSFVRNPYLRIISIYRYYDNGGNRSFIDRRMVDNDVGLNQFLQHYNEDSIGHLRTQHSFLQDSPHLDFIGRFERFSHDLKYLCDRFGTKYADTHERKTAYTRDYVIEPAFIDEISSKYHVDFEKYGYRKIRLEAPLRFSEFSNTYSFESCSESRG